MNNYLAVIIRFASAETLSNLLRLFAGLMVVRMIDPSYYGEFTGFGIYLGYILIGQGGIIQGLSRELPYEMGKNNDIYAQQLASSVFCLTIIISFLSSLAYLFFSIYFFIEKNNINALICSGYVVISGLELLNRLFLPTLYRTNNEFKSLGNQNILVNSANILTVFLVYFFSIYGLIIKSVLIALFEFYLKFKNKPFKLSYRFEFIHMKVLIKTGLPMFIASQSVQLWLTFINNFVYSVGGALNFGLFGLSNIIQNTLGIIPRSMSQVVFPQMTKSLSQGTPIDIVLKSNIKPMLFQFIIMLFICVLGFYLLPIVIPIVLPKYIDGIKAAQWIIFIPLVQSFSSIGNIFAAIKKMKYIIYSNLLGGIISLVYIFSMFNFYGFHLEHFAQGLLLGSFLHQLFMLILIKFIYFNKISY